jgi:hypothetical protein
MTADDRAAVMGLIANYGICIDAGDIDGYVGNFAPDGVLENSSGDARTGQDAIREFFTHIVSIGQVGVTSPWRHVLSLPSIRGDSERCYALTYVWIPRMGEDGRIFTPLVGKYTDEIVKIDGRWRFAKRRIQMDLRT